MTGKRTARADLKVIHEGIGQVYWRLHVARSQQRQPCGSWRTAFGASRLVGHLTCHRQDAAVSPGFSALREASAAQVGSATQRRRGEHADAVAHNRVKLSQGDAFAAGEPVTCDAFHGAADGLGRVRCMTWHSASLTRTRRGRLLPARQSGLPVSWLAGEEAPSGRAECRMQNAESERCVVPWAATGARPSDDCSLEPGLYLEPRNSLEIPPVCYDQGIRAAQRRRRADTVR